MAALWTLKEAAEHIGVPVAPLERVASEHGYLIRVGAAKRIRPDEVEELIEKCRVRPKVPVSTNESDPVARPSGKSATAQRGSRSVPSAVEKLKRRSQNTSTAATGQVAPFQPRK